MNLWLTVEVAPGSGIERTCDEAVALAEKLGITIWFDFNGVKCLARAGDHPRRLEAAWNRVMAAKGAGIQIAADNGDEVPNAALTGGEAVPVESTVMQQGVEK